MLDVSFEIIERGLVFTADEETMEEIQELMRDDKSTYWDVFSEVFEYPICNGLSWVHPEDIGALTDSPIFSDGAPDDDGNYSDDDQFFWFPEYMVTDPIEELATKGKVVFVKGE